MPFILRFTLTTTLLHDMKSSKRRKKKKIANKSKQQNLSQEKRVQSFLIVTISALALLLTNYKPVTIFEKESYHPLTRDIAIRVSPTPMVTPSPKEHLAIGRVHAAETSAQSLGYCVQAPILFYHHVEPFAEAAKAGHQQFTVDTTTFDQQMQYLVSNGYKTTSVSDVVDAIKNHVRLSPKTVALTFDDGYADMHTYAFPTLKKYSLVGNFAIPTGLIGAPGYMSWEQLREIVNSGNMFAYNHTWSHASLNGSSKERIVFEVETAKKDLYEKLGQQSPILFYPYGTFSQEAIGIIKQQGFSAAFSTLSGTEQCEGDIMSLHRTRIGNAPLSFYGLQSKETPN